MENQGDTLRLAQKPCLSREFPELKMVGYFESSEKCEKHMIQTVLVPVFFPKHLLCLLLEKDSWAG